MIQIIFYWIYIINKKYSPTLLISDYQVKLYVIAKGSIENLISKELEQFYVDKTVARKKYFNNDNNQHEFYVLKFSHEKDFRNAEKGFF